MERGALGHLEVGIEREAVIWDLSDWLEHGVNEFSVNQFGKMDREFCVSVSKYLHMHA
jgi:hypothetical protein